MPSEPRSHRLLCDISHLPPLFLLLPLLATSLKSVACPQYVAQATDLVMVPGVIPFFFPELRKAVSRARCSAVCSFSLDLEDSSPKPLYCPLPCLRSSICSPPHTLGLRPSFLLFLHLSYLGHLPGWQAGTVPYGMLPASLTPCQAPGPFSHILSSSQGSGTSCCLSGELSDHPRPRRPPDKFEVPEQTREDLFVTLLPCGVTSLPFPSGRRLISARSYFLRKSSSTTNAALTGFRCPSCLFVSV